MLAKLFKCSKSDQIKSDPWSNWVGRRIKMNCSKLAIFFKKYYLVPNYSSYFRN